MGLLLKMVLRFRYGNYTLFFLFMAVVVSCNQDSKSSQTLSNSKQLLNDTLVIDSLTVLIKSNPNNAGLYNERSLAYERIGKLTKSIDDLSNAHKLDTLNIDYYVRLSDKYLQFGKSEKTRELLLKANSIDDKNVEVLYRLGNLYFYVKDYKQAVSYLKEAKSIDPFYAPLYFTYGMMYKEKGDTAKAIEQFQIAVEREPDYYDAYIILGSLSAAQGDSIAIDYYKNALRILPDSYEAYYSIAMFYQVNDNPEQAIETYKQMLNISRNSFPNVFFNLGYIEMIFYGEFNAAIAYFDSAIQIQENYPAAYCNVGYCYEQLNDKSNAEFNYKKALQLEPNFNIAVLGLERLKNN